MRMWLPMAMPGQIIFLGSFVDAIGGLSHMHMQLPNVTPRPISVLGTVTDAIGLAH